MPDWLSILLAVVGPVVMFLGVVWSRAKTETRMVGRVDLMEANMAAITTAITVRIDSIEKQAEKASESRAGLHDSDKAQGSRLQKLETVCALTHPDRSP
jgi:Mg2+ and Co2+ transporter CorA